MSVYKLRGSVYYYIIGILAVVIILFTLLSTSSAPEELLRHATKKLTGDLLDDIQNATLGVSAAILRLKDGD